MLLKELLRIDKPQLAQMCGEDKMIFKRKVKLEQKIREIVKEELEKALAERAEKLAEIDNELWNLKSALNSAKEAIKRIRAIPIKPPYAYTPEYLIFNSREWKEFLHAAQSAYRCEENIMLYDVVYNITPETVEVKKNEKLQKFTPKAKIWLLVGGFKNKKCTGKYEVLLNLKRKPSPESYATFYIDEKETAIILPKPFGTKANYSFGIKKLEGDPPNFEPIGAIIVPFAS